MRHVLLYLCVVLATACEKSPTGPTVPLNSTFVLAPGSSAAIDEVGMIVRFNSVPSDSRCPAEAVCVWVGDAVVRITTTIQRDARDHELHTVDRRPVRHDDLTIALVQLAPYPYSSGSIAPGDYRATFRVTR
jgi:hypothetical protein